MAYQQFDDVAATSIGYYVYALRDPRDQVVFYVGKGQGNRWFDHIHESHMSPDSGSLKLRRIREIEEDGHEVDAFIVRSGIATEKQAFDVEGAVVHAFRLLEKSGHSAGIDLTNIAEVHQPEKGLVHVKVAQTLFNAPACPDITVPCGLFRIPKLWFPEMDSNQLREATLGWWPESKVKKARSSARFAFAVSRGIIRGVYAIEPSMWRARVEGDRDWEKDIGVTPRWGFPDCRPAPEMDQFLNTSVRHLFKRGDQNSVKFLNC